MNYTMKDDRFLMVENDRFDHLYSVGGRIKFGETAEEAVVREVFEETGRKTNQKYNGVVNSCMCYVCLSHYHSSCFLDLTGSLCETYL